MNILHIIDTTGPGGAETLFVELCKKLAEEGYNCIALLRGPGWVQDQLIKLSIEHYIFDCKGSFNISFIRYLVALLKKHEIDLIQSHLLGSNVYSALAGLLTGIPVIATFHGSVDVSFKERFLAAKFALVNRCAAIVCVSEALRDDLLNRTSIDPKKISIIKNGIDCNRFFLPKHQSLWLEYALPEDAFLVGALGNLRPAKDYPTAIRAMTEVVAVDKSVYLLIAGDIKHALYQQLLDQARDAGVVDHVRFVGFCDAPEKFLSGLDLYLLTSKTEGHPFSIIQAMSTGLPILATRCGVESMFAEMGGAEIVDVGSSHQIASKILELKASLSKREALGKSARNNVLSNYNFSTTLRNYRKLYAAATKTVEP